MFMSGCKTTVVGKYLFYSDLQNFVEKLQLHRGAIILYLRYLSIKMQRFDFLRNKIMFYV